MIISPERAAIIRRIRRMFKPGSRPGVTAEFVADALEHEGPEELVAMVRGATDEEKATMPQARKIRIESKGTHLDTHVEVQRDDGKWESIGGVISDIDIKVIAPGWVTAKVTFVNPELDLIAYEPEDSDE